MFNDIMCIVAATLFSLLLLKWLLLLCFVSFGEKIKKHHFIKNGYNTQKKILNDLDGPSVLNWLINIYMGAYRYLQYHVSLIPSNWLRKQIYKHVFKMKIGKNVVIHFKTEIRGAYKITIGEGTIIGDNVLLDGRNGLYIGKNVNFSSNASIYTAEHDAQDSMFCGKGGPVYIGDRAWISSNSIVLPNVKIGPGAVVCAGAVVTKDLEAFTLNGGVPARKIKDRSQNLEYNFKSSKSTFFY